MKKNRKEREALIGLDFNQNIFSLVLPSIGSTCGSLQADLINEGNQTAVEMHNQYVEEMRKVINCYLDEQKTTFKSIRSVV